MSDFEVPEPILNSPYEEPSLHWWIAAGGPPQKRDGRRPAMYFYRDPKTRSENQGRQGGEPVELKLVNQIRDLVATWRHQGCPGATRTTYELLSWWRRDGREKRLFFAQIEAAETIIFLREARRDFLQGVDIPRDEPSQEQKANGYAGFARYATKLATGSGKTTVMGMLAAWSILNKVNDRSDARFSDVVLVVCPNVTIRQRLAELDPELGEASLYRTRDLVPEHLMKLLRQGKVVITNWHVFEPQISTVGGLSGRILKAGKPVETRERIHIGEQNTTARGKRYLTPSTLAMLTAVQQLEILNGSEKRDEAGNLLSVEVRSTKYVESDSAVVARVLGREIGGKQNILVMNDEAHHAYRIRRDEPDEEEEDLAFGEDEEAEEFYKEATIWVEGLDRVQKLRGINFCVDLSATPYFLGRVGQDANRPFPWVVSDFGLIDAIESGLVKIPQLAIRDTTGGAIVGATDKVPSYFNIWHWILPQLTPAERGGKRANPKPEAILKYAHTPIAMLGGLWEETAKEWADSGTESRPPVFILICKNTALAKMFHEWIAHEVCPTGIPPLRVEAFRNRDGNNYTIRVDSKVVHETDTGGAKGDETRWMRFTLDTVGKTTWPKDRQSREVMPEGFEELAKKLEKPLHPPGRDVRCIVSVGMLTEGWDCNTVTHIVGLRPFMSQLLCEQVVGRGLRRASYEPGADGKLPEEVAKVFGVPFEVVPFKANKGGAPLPPSKRIHVRAVPEKERFALTFPRVDGYTQAIRNRVVVDWQGVPTITIDPTKIPPEVQMKGLHVGNSGRQTLEGPGRIDDVSLKEFRAQHRLQALVFELARELTKSYLSQPGCTVPAHVLFPQCASIVGRYVETKVIALPPADVKDLFLAPYYGWLVERLTQAIRPDTAAGEEPEIPRYEASRGPGSTADVSFFTSRDVREGTKCHLNFAVLDTGKWEQSAVYFIDTHPAVDAFVKNAGLGFAVPYFHNGQPHDYVPDFIVKLSKPEPLILIVETKGYDPLQEVKGDAARRWCNAVNADKRFGVWRYVLCKGPLEVRTMLDGIMHGSENFTPADPSDERASSAPDGPQSTWALLQGIPQSEAAPTHNKGREFEDKDLLGGAHFEQLSVGSVEGEPPIPNKPTDRGDGGVEYTVWYGTNRRLSKTNSGEICYSSERDTKLHYGTCRVLIPKWHKFGVLESTGLSGWFGRVIRKRDDRLTIVDLRELKEAHFWNSLQASLKLVTAKERVALVYIHGYNVSFEDAALRCAQMGVDLKVPGATAFYSWPSRAELKAYTIDEATIEGSESHLTEFLIKFAANSGAERVDVIAHSMGNRGFLRSVIAAEKKTSIRFGQIILAAPDVDADVFRNLATIYPRISDRTTLYVSQKDKALWLSQCAHGYDRAGYNPPIMVIPDIDTVEVSNIDVTLLGHGYYGDAHGVLYDIHELIWTGRAPRERARIDPVANMGNPYWTVRA